MKRWVIWEKIFFEIGEHHSRQKQEGTENILLDSDGEHKDYVKTFFLDSFYYQKDSEIRSAVKIFVKDLFDIDKVFVKSDLDIITEIYKVFNRTVIHV